MIFIRRQQNKNPKLRGLWGVVILLALISPAVAGSLRDDYRAFVMRRQSLEKTRSEYTVKIKALARQQRKLTFSLYKCVTSRRGDRWADLLERVQTRSDRLEAERLRINELRKAIDEVRRSLEQRRVQIEKSHRRKGEGTPYETAFRQYMADLEATYFQRIETDLFTGYRSYISHLDDHLSFLKASLSNCRESGSP
jgi:chromosome segregation ATPase